MSEKFNYVAIGESHPKYFPSILNQKVIQQFENINKYVTNKWKASNDDQKIELLIITSCLEKFQSCILQISRIIDYQNKRLRNLVKIAFDPKKPLMAFREDEACTDFESLLLQIRACLDILTFFISRKFNQKSDRFRFSKLEKILNNFKSDPSAIQISILLNNSNAIKELIVDDKGKKSLRTFVAHTGSISQKMNGCLQIIPIDSGKVILSDISLGKFSIFLNLQY